MKVDLFLYLSDTRTLRHEELSGDSCISAAPRRGAEKNSLRRKEQSQEVPPYNGIGSDLFKITQRGSMWFTCKKLQYYWTYTSGDLRAPGPEGVQGT